MQIDLQTAGLAPIRRFYFDQIAKGGSRGSHFYTLFAARRGMENVLLPNARFGLQSPSFAAERRGIHPLLDSTEQLD